VLKNKDFWIGAVAGFFLGPIVAKTVVTFARKAKGATAPTS
jgi:hypothetical protein